MASPEGFQGFLETSQVPAIVYSIVQLASYPLGVTGSELSLVFVIDASFMPSQHWCQVRSASLMPYRPTAHVQ